MKAVDDDALDFTFEDALNLANAGNNQNVDLLVRDIYGGAGLRHPSPV